MIPRTTIDEANKHITGLHKKVYELEALVKQQNEALHAKDEFHQEKLSELSSAKEMEIGMLQEKVQAKERTVTILQEQMSQKNQQLAVLQRNCRALKKVISFKTDLSELLVAIDEVDSCFKNTSMDLIGEEFYDDERSAASDSGLGASVQLYNGNLTGSSTQDELDHQGYNSSGKHRHKNSSKAREFYL
ncbi:hypothetical protein SNE40_012668 [Patella caerulea]|uniref:Uncharacterized protein n=1 Tax=Patella caerulea TaxID=87958 RepID=A0AAN8JS27_PATCE